MNEREKMEFERQKQKAERQLNEMYYGNSNKNKNSGTKQFSGNSLGKTEGPENIKKKPKDEMPQNFKSENSKKEEKPKSTGINLLNMLNFKGIAMDSDRLIILALCLLLSSEEVDELLLLALIYIML